MLNFDFLILNENVIKTRDGLGTYPELLKIIHSFTRRMTALDLHIDFPQTFKIQNLKFKIDVNRLTTHGL
jgi:hypothetical protein